MNNPTTAQDNRRETLANIALPGLAAAHKDQHADLVAAEAYEMADAMIRADETSQQDREKRILGSEALIKATQDCFDYALKLRTGDIISFSEAKIIAPEWVHLSGCSGLPFMADRGVDVRISDIVWVMDAPNGS